MTEYATGTPQGDGRYRYFFRDDSSGDTQRVEVLIEAVDPQTAEQLAAEAALAEQATEAVMNETGGRFPHSLAEYVGTRTGTNGAQSTLVLRMPKGRGQPFFLEPKIQQTPGILPVSPKVVRKIAIDIYEALTVLHSVGYVHGAVNTESLVWNRREAVLARYRRMASDPDGRQGAIDVADAARLLYHVAIGRPLNGDTLPPGDQRELNSRLFGLGDLIAAALDQQERRISASEAWARASRLVPVENSTAAATPAERREDSPEEAEARHRFRAIRTRHEDIRRRRYPPAPPSAEPRWTPPVSEELPSRSLGRVLLDEGIGAFARRLLGRIGKPAAAASRLVSGKAAVLLLVIVLVVLLGRIL
ncbi:hypothetical protein JCM3263A_00320 [Thermobifida fusca]|jgi:hypothetical protein|uniref:hypothetical protein n=1 Tax=Thermobifida fusca TaxID=2021 RepID=UPI00077C18B7|nr:hypothetical protein [Thermobifida fusca]QOS58595.1 hypothetical protein IM867_14745 [Thermobifida fusca]